MTWDKIKQRIERYFDDASALWYEGRYFRSIIKFVLPYIIIAAITLVTILAVIGIKNFVRAYYVELIVAALVCWGFLGWLDERREKKYKWKEQEREIRVREEYRARLESATTKEATYIEQGKIVFDVARELGVLGIVPPMRLNNIYSPSRTIQKANGTVILAQFLLQKDREEVDIELIRYTLQTKIDQRLMAGEYPSIEEKHIYRGRAYSGFCIDSVRDSEGYVEVYTVLVNDEYCRYRQNRDLMADLPTLSVDRRDTDY